MDYLKSEHLKFKRTISNKLIFIVPLITAIFAWLMGGYIGYQYMMLYRYVLTQIHHEPCDYYQFGNKLTGGMRSCFREQSQFCVLCHTEKKKTPGNTIRYFLCL